MSSKSPACVHVCMGVVYGMCTAWQVVTYRNNLNKIFGTALSPKDSWEVGACLHNGILFLEIITNSKIRYALLCSHTHIHTHIHTHTHMRTHENASRQDVYAGSDM